MSPTHIMGTGLSVCVCVGGTYLSPTPETIRENPRFTAIGPLECFTV